MLRFKLAVQSSALHWKKVGIYLPELVAVGTNQTCSSIDLKRMRMAVKRYQVGMQTKKKTLHDTSSRCLH